MYYLLLSSLPLLLLGNALPAFVPFAMYLTGFRLRFPVAVAILFVVSVLIYSAMYQMGILGIDRAGIYILISFLISVITYVVYSQFPRTIDLLIAGFLYGYFLKKGAGALSALTVALLAYLFKPDPFTLFLLFASLFFASFYLVKVSIAVYRRPDPRQVSIDEVLGMMIVLFFVPLKMPHVIIGWLLFELLDVLKVFPISIFDNLKGEGGVILDDIVAGIMAGVLWVLISSFLPLP